MKFQVVGDTIYFNDDFVGYLAIPDGVIHDNVVEALHDYGNLPIQRLGFQEVKPSNYNFLKGKRS